MYIAALIGRYRQDLTHCRSIVPDLPCLLVMVCILGKGSIR
jgi:hypothetical protein